MDLNQLISSVIADTQASLWPAFGPEIVLCAAIFLLLIVRCFTWGTRIDLSFPLTLVGLGYALYLAEPWTYLGGDQPARELFTGMLVLDRFTAFFRGLLLVFGLLFIVLTRLTGVPGRAELVDFYCLVLGSLLGMCLMTSANHILMVFLAVEMASIPSYVLAGLLKTERPGSEAALKYSIYGAGAAGVMLFGISLLTGILNSAHLPTMGNSLAQMLPSMETGEIGLLVLGGLMLSVGMAFKLSAVPFHFWCPDVFEGATAEIGAFLSVASKAAAFALLVRLVIGFGTTTTRPSAADPVSQVAVATTAVDAGGLFSVDDGTVARHAVAIDSNGPTSDNLVRARQFIAGLIGLLAIATCTFGNLAAYGQTNIKRLMGYSTIAHAGYMLMAIPAVLALIDVDPDGAKAGVAAVALYLVTYLFMNLGVFAIIAFLRNSLNTEEIDDYAGLVKYAPVTVVCMGLMLFSLVGIPPLAGFIGKFAIFGSLVNGYHATGWRLLMILLIVGGLNTVLSLFYYLRVIKVMAIRTESDDTPPHSLSVVPPLGVCYILAVTLPVVVFLVVADPVYEWTLAAASQLF